MSSFYHIVFAKTLAILLLIYKFFASGTGKDNCTFEIFFEKEITTMSAQVFWRQ